MSRVDTSEHPRRLAAVVVGVALALGIAAFIAPGFFQMQEFQRLHAPMKEFMVEALRAGRLPLWNPHVGLGRPFLADPESTVFQPMTLLFVLLGVRPAFVLGFVIHLALGAFGAVRLARRLGASDGPSLWATLFIAGTCVYTQFHDGAFNYACSLAYVPLALSFVVDVQDRPSLRAIATLAMVLGLQLLTHPQPAWLSGFAAITLIVGRFAPPFADGARRTGIALGAMALAVAWGAAIAAVQLLPMRELILESNRAQGSVELASAFAAPVWTWLSLVRPPHAGDPSGQLYVGTALAVMGVLGLFRLKDRNCRGLMAMAVAAGIVAVGNATPIFPLLVRILPFMDMLRLPSRAAAIVLLAVVVAAAISFSNPRGGRRDVWRWLLVSCLGLGILIVSRWLGNSIGGPGWGWHVAAFLATVGLVGIVLFRPETRSTRVAAGLLVAVTGIQLVFSVVGLKGTARIMPGRTIEDEVQRTLSTQGLLIPGMPPPRVSIPFPYARENAGMQHGYSTYAGYGPLFLSRVWKTVHRLRNLVPPSGAAAFIADNIYDGGAFPFDGMSLSLGIDRATHKVALRPHPDPRAYVAFASTLVKHVDEALAKMARGHDFRRNALVETPLPLSGGPSEGAARILAFSPESMALEVEAQTHGIVVVGESYYPGWHATVNGKPAQVIPVNAWMRGVPVEAGSSHVELEFHCDALLPGSLLTLVALFALLLATRRRSAARPKPS